MNLWTRDVLVLALLVVLFALLLVLHLFLWLHSLRAPGVPRLLRFFTFLPPLAAVAGYRAGARFTSILWLIVLVAYLVLRSRA